ncbi:hypothetical protein MAMC_01747 [Methylacidimicrobium cyclopophantes]|uniref:Uncharacterized protein n=1 Tax=Methylacidimicrobium cyclopophantes TaxID=1041766 RepID=A0A5E6MDW0_9BACT|nr:hypothetical protein [Methylacidimicrobium cyclopophantes]VVM07652.1 hypothetical protein MAMC_01747 [Methylacidimicrobium cyclopophantes]
MDLSLPPLTAEAVESAEIPEEALADWREAASRLDAYLGYWRLADPFYQRVVGVQLLALSIREWKKNPEKPPVELTMEFTQQLVEGWLERLPSASPTGERERRVAAILSLQLSRALDHWPRAFLSGAVPPELSEKLLRMALQAGPAVRFSHMVSRPIEYGPFARLAREAWEQVSWKEVGSILLFWTVLFGAACAVYFLFFSR